MTASPESDSKVKSGAGSPSLSTKPSIRRAIGIARQSRAASDDSISLPEQRQRIEAACEREGFQLLDVLPEPDVSGGAPLRSDPASRARWRWWRRGRPT